MSKKPDRAKQGRPALDPEAQRRHLQRHLDSLERDNFQAVPEYDIAIVAGAVKKDGEIRKTRKKSKGDIRRLLLTKKNLNLLIEESKIELLPPTTPTYITAAVAPSSYPPRKFCTVCGFQSCYSCVRCGMRYCSKKCLETHEETRWVNVGSVR
ncbi:hypothetical protein BC938DRAFT_475146 [Jimgerdemannia flammicorona]|uniref:HIT-type domain-containing protein n=1 Tax=Jimgerdemannia flammicorona TaxID=994334 RepID=A0A433QS00_9FUNG|nr:hypothetical protein BC938DRAFT_475146 [Jimgerdemannia flammicorona]